MPPRQQRPISSVWMKYPAGQQGPGQQPALAAQQNPFAQMRSDYDSSFQFLMNSLGKYMGGNR
jgi:hypothetical protein